MSALQTASTLLAQVSTPDSEASFNAVEVGVALAGSVLTAVVSVYAVRAQGRKDPLDRRKAELEIMEKERALGLAREQHDVVRIAELTAEPVLERRQVQDILVRFVLLYLVLQVWGIVGSLFVVGLGSGFFDVAAIIPQIVRALIFVSIGWPLLLDTTRVLDVALPNYMYKPAIKWVLVAVAALAAISGQLFRGALFF